MHVMRDAASIQEGARSYPSDCVRQLIATRIQELAEDGYDAADLMHVFVVAPGDDMEGVEVELGFPLLANRFTGACFGEPEFTPSWDVLEDHGDCYELVYVVSDDGFGLVVFVPKQAGMNPDLLSMCATYAQGSPS